MESVTPAPKSFEQDEGKPVTSKDLAKLLLTTHKDYDAMYPKWESYLLCYEGEETAKLLKKHTRESDDLYKIRKERAYYLNYCEPVVDLYTHYIFSKPVIRSLQKDDEDEAGELEGESSPMSNSAVEPVDETEESSQESDEEDYDEELGVNIEGSEEWGDWLKNVDKRGSNINRFMSQTAKYSFTLGHAYIVVDMPYSEKELKTEQDRKEGGIVPYLSSYLPQDIINYATDQFGGFLWVRILEECPQDEDPFSMKVVEEKARQKSIVSSLFGDRTGSPFLKDRLKNLKKVRVKTWTKDKWFLHEISSEGAYLVREGEHPVKEVPVIPVYNKRYVKPTSNGKSLLCNISQVNIAIYNWSSLLDEEIFEKCLNILCLQRSQTSPAEIIIGTNNTLEYDGAPPFFLAPATDPGAFIQAQIEKAIQEIFRLAKLGGGLGVEMQTQRSGVAHAFEFNETNRTLAEKADELERAENLVHKFYHAWLGSEWQGSIDYPDSFSVESFDVEINLATTAKQTISSETFHNEMDKRVVKKILHNINENKIRQIISEIKKSNKTNFAQQEFNQQVQNQQSEQSLQSEQPSQQKPQSSSTSQQSE